MGVVADNLLSNSSGCWELAVLRCSKKQNKAETLTSLFTSKMLEYEIKS
jgi:hypothetical protein